MEAVPGISDPNHPKSKVTVMMMLMMMMMMLVVVVMMILMMIPDRLFGTTVRALGIPDDFRV